MTAEVNLSRRFPAVDNTSIHSEILHFWQMPAEVAAAESGGHRISGNMFSTDELALPPPLPPLAPTQQLLISLCGLKPPLTTSAHLILFKTSRERLFLEEVTEEVAEAVFGGGHGEGCGGTFGASSTVCDHTWALSPSQSIVQVTTSGITYEPGSRNHRGAAQKKPLGGQHKTCLRRVWALVSRGGCAGAFALARALRRVVQECSCSQGAAAGASASRHQGVRAAQGAVAHLRSSAVEGGAYHWAGLGSGSRIASPSHSNARGAVLLQLAGRGYIHIDSGMRVRTGVARGVRIAPPRYLHRATIARFGLHGGRGAFAFAAYGVARLCPHRPASEGRGTATVNVGAFVLSEGAIGYDAINIGALAASVALF
ncbi:hypothetical protein B0H13DRAFT_1903219 [Mycena leptocephala]|nr:hypothetical protein B0H13DRAFT_1903219 [Mycena leptocephala]